MDIPAAHNYNSRNEMIESIASASGIDDIVILDAACAILFRLHETRQDMPECEVRKLHLMMDLPQPIVLRAILHLEQGGLLERDENLHDPLGSRISVSDAAAAMMHRLLHA